MFYSSTAVCAESLVRPAPVPSVLLFLRCLESCSGVGSTQSRCRCPRLFKSGLGPEPEDIHAFDRPLVLPSRGFP